jgi:gamma-glutamyltranspeptidase/glutathione hydrolase
MLLLERYGTWRVEDVLAPAIDLLENGSWAGPWLTAALDEVEPLFAEHWPTSAALWMPQRSAAHGAGVVSNPTLADTYRRVLREACAGHSDREAQIEAARRAWYEGFVADAIATFSAAEPWMDTSGTPHRGLLTGDDLAGWTASLEAPITLDYQGYTVAKTNTWGQGPVFLQQLALLKGFDLSEMGRLSPDYIHVVVESAKLAFADREAWYGDGHDDALPALLSTSYNDDRRKLISAEASMEMRPGSPEGRVPTLPASIELESALLAGAGDPTRGPVDRDTAQLNIVDRWGNMVSATPSGGWLQSSPAIPSLGFCLGTRAQMFCLDAGHPNCLKPGKRPRTTLSPGLALRDDAPWMAFGTPGGDQQDQWSLNFFLTQAEFGLSIRDGLDAPTWHTEHFPGSFYPKAGRPGNLTMESDHGPDTVAALRRRGHDVDVVPPLTLGKVSAVSRTGVLLRAAADMRAHEPSATGR